MTYATSKKLVKTLFAVLCTLAVIHCSPSESAEKTKEKKAPATLYWMSVSTQNQTIPGMSDEMSGMGEFMGKRLGGPGFGASRSLRLYLNSLQPLPNEPSATHDIPLGQKMGGTLPLLIPEQKGRAEKGPEERVEKPKLRMLLYWGCSETVGKGQPRIIDTEKMTPLAFGSALKGHTPSPQYPPSPRAGWIYADWPNKKSSVEIPKDSSLRGIHFVHGNYLPDIKFTIDRRHDFMAPVEFTSVKGDLTESVRFMWKDIPTAIGYFATAMAHNEKSGEMIIWSSSAVPDPGYGLMDYLPSNDVKQFIRDKVVMDPDTTTCAIPKGIFKESNGGMIQFIAYGDDMYASSPPKPKDPKEPWDLIWSVRLRLKSTGMIPLGMDAADPQRSGEKEGAEPFSDDRKSGEEETESTKTLKKLKGIFRF